MNSIHLNELDQAKLASESAPGVSSLIVEAATAHVLPIDGGLMTDEMRIELLALLQDFITPGIAHQLGITEETLITACLLNKKGHKARGGFSIRRAAWSRLRHARGQFTRSPALARPLLSAKNP